MQIQTSRFGVLQVEADDIATFPQGIIGFSGLSRYVMVPAAESEYFWWLQAADDPEVAFLVTDPRTFFKDYAVPIREEMEALLRLDSAAEARLLVICNKVGEWLTGNLQGPIVLNEKSLLAQQVVLTEKKWTTRQPLARLTAERRLAKAA